MTIYPVKFSVSICYGKRSPEIIKKEISVFGALFPSSTFRRNMNDFPGVVCMFSLILGDFKRQYKAVKKRERMRGARMKSSSCKI